jgi:hypothetical protein
MSEHLEVNEPPPTHTHTHTTPPLLIHRVWFDAAVGLLARKDESRSSVDAQLVKRRVTGKTRSVAGTLSCETRRSRGSYPRTPLRERERAK